MSWTRTKLGPMVLAVALIATVAGVRGWSASTDALAGEPARGVPAGDASASDAPAVDAADGDDAAGHAMQSVRLRMLMLALEQLTFEDLAEPLDQDPLRQRYLGEVVEAADGLARAADEIPDAIEPLDLTPEQEESFRSRARRLRADAIDLRDRAASGEIGSAEMELDPILARCNDCHRAFDIDPMGSRAAGE